MEYKYLGNSKFGTGTMVNKKTVKDSYSSSECAKVKVFTDLITNKVCTTYNDKVTCFSNNNYGLEKENLIKLFGENSCEEQDDSNYTQTYCNVGKYGCIAEKSGAVRCNYDDEMCSTDEKNISSCGFNAIPD